MSDLIIFILATIGMTKIVVDGVIAQPFRDWVRENKPTYKVPGFVTYLTKVEKIDLMDIITCNQCCGFWSGIFCGTLMLLPSFFLNDLLLLAFASSYVCMLGSIVVDYYNALLYIDEDGE